MCVWTTAARCQWWWWSRAYCDCSCGSADRCCVPVRRGCLRASISGSDLDIHFIARMYIHRKMWNILCFVARRHRFGGSVYIASAANSSPAPAPSSLPSLRSSLSSCYFAEAEPATAVDEPNVRPTATKKFRSPPPPRNSIPRLSTPASKILRTGEQTALLDAHFFWAPRRRMIIRL